MRRPLVLFTALLLLAGPADAAPSAPGFRVTTLDGRTIDSKGLIGQKVIVLRFQASYCKPCVKESAALAQVAEKYRDRGVEVIAIHVQDATPDVRAFVQAQKATYAVALDPRLNLGNRFGFRGTPYTVVIDRKGEMVARVHGEGVVRRLPRTLDGLLKQNKP
jgi:peroxiredoxin